jgi:hypothetical protein
MFSPQTTTEWVCKSFSHRGHKIVWLKITYFRQLDRFLNQTSPWHCYTFIWRLRHDLLENDVNSCLEQLLSDLFQFVENLLEMATREVLFFVKGCKSNQSSRIETLSPLKVKTELCRWVFRLQTTTEWVFKSFSHRGRKIVGLKITYFRQFDRFHNQTSPWHCYTFIWRPRHDLLENDVNYCLEQLLSDLFEFVKNLLEMATRETYSFCKRL